MTFAANLMRHLLTADSFLYRRSTAQGQRHLRLDNATTRLLGVEYLQQRIKYRCRVAPRITYIAGNGRRRTPVQNGPADPLVSTDVCKPRLSPAPNHQGFRHEHTTNSSDNASSTESIFDACLATRQITLRRYSIGSRGSKRAQQKADVYLFHRQQLPPQAAVH